MKKTILTVAAACFCICLSLGVQAQAVSASGFLGWAVPGGSGVSDEPEDLNLDGGLTYGLDAMYHLNENLGVGLQFNRSVLAGAGGGDIDLFGMRFFGAKAQYRFFENKVSPYAGLALGLSTLLTPEYSVTTGTETTVYPESTGSTFGILPEAGIYFGGLFIGVQYLVPLAYTIDEAGVVDKSLGTLGINIGYRYTFEL